MKNIITVFCIHILLLLNSGNLIYSQSSEYKIINKISVPVNGKWDFVTFDNSSRRLYISHGSVMQVIDVDKEKLLGEVTNTLGIHGIALATEMNKGYTSNGKDSTVTVFDLKTFVTIKTIKLQASNPDHIIYDNYSKKIFVFNNKSKNASIVDPATDLVVKTLSLGGNPELAVSDNQGLIFVNLEDKAEVAVIDSKNLLVKNKWSLSPGEEPTGLSLDLKNNRLFAGCSNKLMIVMDSKTGKVIAKLTIGDYVDGTAYDPEKKLLFSSNGEGTITVIRQDGPDKYSVLQNIVTKKGAKTLALDEEKHRLYLPCSDYNPPIEKTGSETPKPTITPNTFGILVVGN
jgi:DNA-binding beta-propeller fold protein YncE